MKKEKKKQIAKISVFITSIFVIFLSVTYAFINITLTGTRRQVVTAGNLELELLEDENNLTVVNAMPMYDEVGMIQEAFTFRLINKTATDTNYTVRLVDITTGEKLNTNIVKYELTKDEEKTIKPLSTLKNGEIDKGKISGNQTINYSLRLWIDSSVEDNTEISGKTLSYRIDVEVNQDIEKPIYAMMKKRDFSNSTEAFWKYKNSITSVVFENRIQVPDTIEEDHKWDVSEDQNGSIMAYIEPDSEGSTTYQLHIQGKDGIAANTDSSYLFRDFLKLTTIEGLEYFNTSKVTRMSHMFYGCTNLTSLDLSSFDTSNVTYMDSMFIACNNLAILDISNFNTSKVMSMSHMFKNCSSLTSLDLSSFNTSNVTNMEGMFYGYSSSQPLDLSHFNTSNVTNMSQMFYRYSSNRPLDLSPLDTSSVTNMSSMFREYSSSQLLDLSSLNTSKVTDMSYMFSEYSSSQPLNLSHFNTSNVTEMDGMFNECSSLTSLDLSNFDTSKVIDMRYMFDDCSKLMSLDLSDFDISKVTSTTDMFGSVKNDCLIIVKDETTKTWVLGVNGSLTNVVVKSA